jgi:DNA-binding MarR family transcriptional regulator
MPFIPSPTSPLLRSLRAKASSSEAAPKLSDYPHLALAATATTAGLDTASETFHAVQGCLETLCRLKLSKRSALLLIVLARHGTLTMARVADALKVTQPNCSLITRRMESLGLVACDRQGPDLRRVHVTITEPGTKVLASLVALTGLAGASSVLLRGRN